jgi:CheY-like chemotaxis protein
MAKKILIVEDVEDSRAILVVMLQRYCGYETMEAATGLEAVEKAIADNPILSSWISGYPVCQGSTQPKY